MVQGCRSSQDGQAKVWRVPSIKLAFKVSKAKASFSIANSPRHPARIRPRLKPPQPAKASMKTGLLSWLSTPKPNSPMT
ncbi:hypothetical protein D3C72_1882280 [compost metagenome]